MNKEPKVSVALIVRKDDKVLLGKRRKPPIAWGFPGGKLGFNEDVEECVLRELNEEVGIKVNNLRFRTVTNDFLESMGEHYVTLIFTADYESGNVILKEPKKCKEWKWFLWDNLPENLSTPIANLLKQNFNPFDELF